MLFEVAIIKKPTKKEVEEGTGSKDAPQGLDMSRAEVLVRPFA